MKATAYTLIILVAGALIAWLVYDGRRKEKQPVLPVANFAADDERVYNLIRSDLQAYEMQKNNDTLTWFDDLVSANYDNSTIAGMKSKTAAYVQTLNTLNPNHPKRRYYNQLLSNLEKRYTKQ